MKRYLVTIIQNNIGVQTITNYATSNNSARLKALRMFKRDNPKTKGIIAIAKHSDFYGNEIPEDVTNYNYSIPYVQ